MHNGNSAYSHSSVGWERSKKVEAKQIFSRPVKLHDIKECWNELFVNRTRLATYKPQCKLSGTHTLLGSWLGNHLGPSQTMMKVSPCYSSISIKPQSQSLLMPLVSTQKLCSSQFLCHAHLPPLANFCWTTFHNWSLLLAV